jgi:hypothetical protein
VLLRSREVADVPRAPDISRPRLPRIHNQHEPENERANRSRLMSSTSITCLAAFRSAPRHRTRRAARTMSSEVIDAPQNAHCSRCHSTSARSVESHSCAMYRTSASSFRMAHRLTLVFSESVWPLVLVRYGSLAEHGLRRSRQRARFAACAIVARLTASAGGRAQGEMTRSEPGLTRAFPTAYPRRTPGLLSCHRALCHRSSGCMHGHPRRAPGEKQQLSCPPV